MKTNPFKYLHQSKNNYYLGIFVLVFIFSFLIFFVRGYHKKISFISGDEPHYIMMTDSLVKDNDFNLKNDYILGRSSSYYDGPNLMPHVSVSLDIKGNKWYSIHTIGLPFLYYLPYKLFGVIGVRIVVCLVQILAVYLFFLILKKYIVDSTKVLIGLLLIVSCSLFWQNFGGLFPDLIMVTFMGASILLFGKKSLFSNLVFMLIIFSGTLMHTKMAVLLAPIYIAHLIQLIRVLGFRKFATLYAGLFFILVAGLYMYIRFLYINYGVFSPTGLYGNNGQLFSANLITNSIAIITDRVKGLLIYYPVLAIMGVYLVRAAQALQLSIKKVLKIKYISPELLLGLGVFLGSLMLLATQLGFTDWSGSYAPNGRYMLVFVFILVFLMSKYLNFHNKFEKITVIFFILLNFIVSILTSVFLTHYTEVTSGLKRVNQIFFINTFPSFKPISAQTNISHVTRGLGVIVMIIIFNIVLFYAFSKAGRSKITQKL